MGDGERPGKKAEEKGNVGASVADALKLVEADRMALLGTMAAGVAHEINNPLTYVRLALGRLLSLELSRKPFDEITLHRIELLQEAKEGVDRVSRVLREVQTFTRTEDDRVTDVDVRLVLESALRVASHDIRHRARLVRDYRDVPHVRASAMRLGQVFLNLLLNAARSIDAGEAHLNEIRVRVRAEGKDRVVVEVRDSGVGIPPDQIKDVFEPFRPSPGGLGLSICRELVREIKGEIDVESVLGKGSVFRVTLPASEGAPAVRPMPAPSEPESRDEEFPRAGRILVIDDERAVAAAVAAELGDTHEVVVAGSGREAFEILRKDDAFDVILCDLLMGEVTGMDVYETVRLVFPALLPRIIFMTGGAFTPEAQEFLDGVPNPVIEKPFSREILEEAIQDCLVRAESAAAGAPQPPPAKLGTPGPDRSTHQ